MPHLDFFGPDWRQVLFAMLMAGLFLGMVVLERRRPSPPSIPVWCPPRPPAGPAEAPPDDTCRAAYEAMAEQRWAIAHHLLRLALAEERSPWVTYHLGLVLQAQGYHAEAVAYYQATLALAPHHRGARYNMARLHQEAGALPEAVGAYQRLLKDYPADVDALYNLGLVYFTLKLYGKAGARWNAARKLAPEATDVRANLRMLRAIRGKARPRYGGA